MSTASRLFSLPPNPVKLQVNSLLDRKLLSISVIVSIMDMYQKSLVTGTFYVYDDEGLAKKHVNPTIFSRLEKTKAKIAEAEAASKEAATEETPVEDTPVKESKEEEKSE